LQSQIDGFTRQARVLEDERATVAGELERSRAQAAALEHENAALLRQIGLLEQERDRAIGERDRSDCIRQEIELQAEREMLLRQIDGLKQDCQRARADANELVLARKAQRQSLVKIARLTRSLQNAWKRIELLRLRYQELVKQTAEKVEENRGNAPARGVPFKVPQASLADLHPH
jgi:hypothetical protein